jgi:hypothetical protein
VHFCNVRQTALFVYFARPIGATTCGWASVARRLPAAPLLDFNPDTGAFDPDRDPWD